MSLLADARHQIANQLAEYCRAVDEHDGAAVADLLAETQLVFRGQHLAGRDDISDFYAAAFTTPATTQHVVTNLWVDSTVDGAVCYRAAYQRWTSKMSRAAQPSAPTSVSSNPTATPATGSRTKFAPSPPPRPDSLTSTKNGDA